MDSPRIHALAPEHIPFIVEACANWRELAQWGPPYWRPRSAAELQRKIADTSGPMPAGAYTFVIEDGGTLIGECSLHAIDWRNRHAQVGVCIWNPEHRHRGYGRFGVGEMVNWARDELGLVRLEAWILVENGASCSLFESLGFTREGVLRKRYRYGGVQHDVCVYGLLIPED